MSPIQNFPLLREVEIHTFIYWVNVETVYTTGTKSRHGKNLGLGYNVAELLKYLAARNIHICVFNGC